MATNEILVAVETDTGTNLLTQAEYLADAQRLIGNQPGIARSKLVNKILRQTSLIAAAVAQYIAGRQAVNVTDSLTSANLALYLHTAMNNANTGEVTGVADAILVGFAPAATAFQAGLIYWKADFSNATTTPTLARDALAAKTIVKGPNLPLAADDIRAGMIMVSYYDSVLDKEVLINPTTGVSIATAKPLPKRQAVLSSLIDANGFPVFLTTAASLNLPILATAVPLRLSAANGYDANGQVDRLGSATADTTLLLPNGATSFIYADVSSLGVLTFGYTSLLPVYQRSGAYAVTAGQFTFNTVEMVGKVGNGAAAVQTYRVFLGEAVTSAGAVTSVVNYALNREYQSAVTAVPAVNSNTNFNSNLGFTAGVDAWMDLINAGADLGYAVGDVHPHAITQYNNGGYIFGESPVSLNSRNTVRITTSNNGGTSGYSLPSISAGPGNLASINNANWRVQVSAKPNW